MMYDPIYNFVGMVGGPMGFNLTSSLVVSLLSLLWSSVGPLASSAITAWVNTIVGKYVPRPVQIILSSVIGAVTAGLSGSMVGLDPLTATGIGFAGGLAGQTFVSLHPKTMLSSAPET